MVVSFTVFASVCFFLLHTEEEEESGEEEEEEEEVVAPVKRQRKTKKWKVRDVHGTWWCGGASPVDSVVDCHDRVCGVNSYLSTSSPNHRTPTSPSGP